MEYGNYGHDRWMLLGIFEIYWWDLVIMEEWNLGNLVMGFYIGEEDSWRINFRSIDEVRFYDEDSIF